MSFVHLIFHNIGARRARSFFTTVAVAFGVAVVVTLGVVTSSLRQSAAAVLQTGSADFTVAQKGMADVLNSTMGERELAEIRGYSEVASAVGALITIEKLNEDNPAFIRIGLPPSELSVFGVRVLEGHAYTARSTNELMLGFRAAQHLHKKVGDRMVVGDDPYTVVGIYSTGNEIGDSASMFPLVHLQASMRLTGNVTLTFVRVRSGTDVEAFRKRLETENPQLTTVRFTTEFGRVDRNLQLISAADRGAAFISWIIGSVIVMNTMLLSFFERTREFGLLRAVGWSRFRVMVLVISEALIISVGGASMGVGLSYFGTTFLQRLPQLRGLLEPEYSAGIFWRALYLAGGMALCGAIYPSLRAAFLVPLKALRRE